MKIKGWMRPVFLKNVLVNYFFGFHYIIIMGIITLIISLGIITSGPALIALSSTMRKIVSGEKGGFKFYFSEFIAKFKIGIFLSLVIFLVSTNIYLIYSFLYIQNSEISTNLVYFSFLSVALLILIFMYYPIASYGENNVKETFKKSFIYFILNFLDTLACISLLYIVYRIYMLFPILIILLYLPTSVYIINTFVIGNNNEIEKAQGEKAQEEKAKANKFANYNLENI